MGANGGERVTINLTMATSSDLMAWLLSANADPAAAIEACPESVRAQLEQGASAGKAKREHLDAAERRPGLEGPLSIEEALAEALAARFSPVLIFSSPPCACFLTPVEQVSSLVTGCIPHSVRPPLPRI
jgi:hypothetical protein